MMNRIEIAERSQWGNLIALYRCGVDRIGKQIWRCRCLCGNMTYATASAMRLGKKKSCGCLKAETARSLHLKHGLTGTREYRAWRDMINRCTYPNRKGWKDYGGRGIAVCDKWRRSFTAFLTDMGKCPEGHTLDRINVNGDYYFANCRWATRSEQARNTRAALAKLGEAK